MQVAPGVTTAGTGSHTSVSSGLGAAVCAAIEALLGCAPCCGDGDCARREAAAAIKAADARSLENRMRIIPSKYTVPHPSCQSVRQKLRTGAYRNSSNFTRYGGSQAALRCFPLTPCWSVVFWRLRRLEWRWLMAAGARIDWRAAAGTRVRSGAEDAGVFDVAGVSAAAAGAAAQARAVAGRGRRHSERGQDQACLSKYQLLHLL